MNFEFSDPIFYNWSRTRDSAGFPKQPFPDDVWIPGRDIAFASGGMWSATAVRDGGRLTSETIENLLAFNCVVKTNAHVRRDVIEVFATLPHRMPLLSGHLRYALENEFPRVFEFVELPEVWNETSQEPLPGGPYSLANLLARLDSWDKKKTKFYDFKRGDGSRYTEAAKTKRFISGEMTAEFPIWRDRMTSNVICTERFREVVEGAGCKEWCFVELPTA